MSVEGPAGLAADELALEHGSPSPAKCTRLGQIARLSSEFAKVMRSPRSNFTSYLARCSNVVAGTCVGVGKQALGIEIFFLISGEDSRFKAGGQPLDCFFEQEGFACSWGANEI